MAYNQSVLTGEQTQNATKGGQPVLYLWDKIINIRLHRADGKNGITIRSDYEARAIKDSSGNSKYFLCRMEQKPSIKVKYNQMTGGVATKIVVEIKNLYTYLYSADGANDYSQANNPFVAITIEMGYFSNFTDLSDSQGRASGMGAKDLVGKILEQYNRPASSDQTWVRSIDANILSMYQSKPAPDAVTTINCVVGDITSAFNPVPNKEAKDQRIKKGGTFEDLFYTLVTKRFVSRAIYCSYVNKTDNNRGQDVIQNPDGTKTVRHFRGTLTDEDAAKYGVKVYMTKSIRERRFDSGLYFAPVTDNAEQMMNAIKRQFTDIKFERTSGGDYIVYNGKTETVADAGKAYLLYNNKPHIIPAVYNVSLGALRMVSCPFFGFIDPFSLINFNARYTTSNLVGTFYKPAPGSDTFMSLKCVITFSTCDGDNEMLLTSTDEETSNATV